VASCRSCGASIEWATTNAGNAIPLDPGEFEDGNIVLAQTEERGMVAQIRSAGEGNRRSHFASCPNAPEHRRSRR